VFVTDVPLLRRSKHNEARRFITFVDVAYDHGVDLHMSAAAPPERLFDVLLRSSHAVADNHAVGAGSSASRPSGSVRVQSGTGPPAPEAPILPRGAMGPSGSERGLALDATAAADDVVDEEVAEDGDVAGSHASADVATGLQRPVVSVVTSSAERAAMGELVFACRRAVSRLVEMTSGGYARKLATQMARRRASTATGTQP
jgi:predicted ATPase